jgi:hypothetical protein
MRPHGHADISEVYPRALGVCDRCGFLWNLDRLKWQWDWQQGPRLFNLRILVCPPCLDVPQESGRTIVLPPDPIPVEYARPENYALADNPVSPLGWSPLDNFLGAPSSLGGNIGNMVNNGGLDAAFNFVGQSSAVNSTSATALFAPNTAGVINKRYEFCAALSVSNSSFNWVGKNWNAVPSGVTLILPSTIATVSHTVSGFAAFAPNDQPFLRTGTAGWVFQGSNDDQTWTTLSSGATAGTNGEVLTVTTTAVTPYPFHRFAIVGDGVSAVGIAGLSISISDAAVNDI